MRKLILSVLLATSVAMPAMAQDRDGRERDAGGEVHRASSATKPARRGGAERAERPQRAERPSGQQAVAAAKRRRSEVRAQRRAFDADRGERRDWRSAPVEQ